MKENSNGNNNKNNKINNNYNTMNSKIIRTRRIMVEIDVLQ